MKEILGKCPYCGAELTEGTLKYVGISGLGDAEAYVWGVFDDGKTKKTEPGFLGIPRIVQERVFRNALTASKCPQCRKYFAVFEENR